MNHQAIYLNIPDNQTSNNVEVTKIMHINNSDDDDLTNRRLSYGLGNFILKEIYIVS